MTSYVLTMISVPSKWLFAHTLNLFSHSISVWPSKWICVSSKWFCLTFILTACVPLKDLCVLAMSLWTLNVYFNALVMTLPSLKLFLNTVHNESVWPLQWVCMPLQWLSVTFTMTLCTLKMILGPDNDSIAHAMTLCDFIVTIWFSHWHICLHNVNDWHSPWFCVAFTMTVYP